MGTNPRKNHGSEELFVQVKQRRLQNTDSRRKRLQLRSRPLGAANKHGQRLRGEEPKRRHKRKPKRRLVLVRMASKLQSIHIACKLELVRMACKVRTEVKSML